MTPHELAIRLVALRQASLEPGGKPIRRSYREELTVSTAWLQTRPAVLERVLNVLISEIATSRRELGLPVLDAPAWSIPADPPIDLTASDDMPADLLALLDRLAVQLAAAAADVDWELDVTVGIDGATARPARSA